MQASTILEKFKIQLQQSLAESLEGGIDTLIQSVDDRSNHKINIFQLKGRFNEIEADTRQGVIKYEDKILYTNQIRMSLMEMINEMDVTDISLNEPLLNEEEKSYLKKLRQTTAPPLVAPESFETEPSPTGQSYTLEELKIYKSLHTKRLQYYPVLYRKISSLIFSQSKDTELISKIMNRLKRHENLMTTYRDTLSSIKAIENDLYHKEKWDYYKIMIDKQMDFKSKLTEDTIDELEKFAAELQTFHQELQADKLI